MSNKTYPIDVNGVHRDLPIIRISENLSIASFVILGDNEIVTAAADKLKDMLPKADYLMTAEAKGVPLAHELANAMGYKKYIVARKNVKAYMDNPLIATVESITTKGQQILCLDRADADTIKGKTVLLVDDVISTGESIQSLAALAEKAGAQVIGKASILVEGDPENHKDVINLGCIPVFPD